MTDADVLREIVSPDGPTWNEEAARSILELRFSERAIGRMRELLDRNHRGTLTPGEQDDLEKYRRVGLLMDLLQAKARQSLQQTGSS